MPEAGTSRSIQWYVIIHPCPRYLLLAQHTSIYHVVAALGSLTAHPMRYSNGCLLWIYHIVQCIHVTYLSIFSRVASLALKQLCDCHSLNEVYQKNKDKIVLYQQTTECKAFIAVQLVAYLTVISLKKWIMGRLAHWDGTNRVLVEKTFFKPVFIIDHCILIQD